MLINRDAEGTVKLLKIMPLLAYAQTHERIWCVLIVLQLPYAEPHAPYDQTHEPYAEAHASKTRIFVQKSFNHNLLQSLRRFDRSFYMEWFMVWINLTRANADGHTRLPHGWIGVCLPIKTQMVYGLHRKPLEQNARLMLQKQKRHCAL
jgi:hypothetical protein